MPDREWIDKVIDKVTDEVKMGFYAILVGTSLLKASAGVESILQEFEQALGSS